MKDTLQPGLVYEFRFRVPETKTVPQLFSEAAEFQQMPEVFATGFMVGLCEWACIQAKSLFQQVLCPALRPESDGC